MCLDVSMKAKTRAATTTKPEASDNKSLGNAGQKQERNQETMPQTTVMDMDEITLDRKPPPTRCRNTPVNCWNPRQES